MPTIEPPNRPLRIGLTGGVASGKSTVANCFAARGIPIIDTDQIAREVVAPGRPALAEIAAEFGPGLLTADGQVDRQRMRDLVFADRDARTRLEAILHPRILDEMNRCSTEAGGSYQIIVVPLLVETGLEQEFDRVLVVDCHEHTQIERLIERDKESRDSARAILTAQATRRERLAHADDVITNDGDLAALKHRVDELHQFYLRLAGNK